MQITEKNIHVQAQIPIIFHCLNNVPNKFTYNSDKIVCFYWKSVSQWHYRQIRYFVVPVSLPRRMQLQIYQASSIQSLPMRRNHLSFLFKITKTCAV
jgi:hypothetical protein